MSRLRFALEGSRAFSAGSGAALTPTLELGLRLDGGDVETGTGVEAGFGLKYADPARGLTVEGRVRGLVTHSDRAYEEWGASGSFRLDPGVSGRGLSLAVTPVWGPASGGVERLRSEGASTSLALEDAWESTAGLQAELGYGVRIPHTRGLVTPYAGLTLAGEGDRTMRTGARWNVAPGATVGVEGTRSADDGNAMAMRLTVIW